MLFKWLHITTHHIASFFIVSTIRSLPFQRGVKGMGGVVRRGKPDVRWIPQKPRRNLRLRLDRNTREGETQRIHHSLFSSILHPGTLSPFRPCSAVQCSAESLIMHYYRALGDSEVATSLLLPCHLPLFIAITDTYYLLSGHLHFYLHLHLNVFLPS